MRVLIVDDSPVTRELVRDILETSGHEIIEAADGISALQQIEDKRPQVVLLDIEIPGLDGYAVVRRIRQDPRFADLRVAEARRDGLEDLHLAARQAEGMRPCRGARPTGNPAYALRTQALA